MTRANKIEESEYFYVVPNTVKYDLWELHHVAEHLLLVPKEHIETLNELDDNRRLDAMKIIGRYEAEGFSVYARGVASARRSVPHQHTHLIKITGNQAKGAFFIKRPHMLLKF